MERPGLTRAIPGAILGVVLGVVLVVVLRAASGLEPLWDNGLALVVLPFTVILGWMWGIGAFNPKLSEHGDHADHEEQAIVPAEEEEAHEEEEEARPATLLMSQMWRITTFSLLAVAAVFAFAALPLGFFVRVTGEAEASTGDIATEVTVNFPIVGEFVTSQLVLFLIVVAAVVISLLLIGGLLGLLFYAGHGAVANANATTPTRSQVTPPAPVRWLGRGSRNLARGLRKGLPKFLGQ